MTLARTQLGGNRIAPKAIKNIHLSDDLQIPEKNIKLNYATHNHENKSAIDIIKNSNPALVKELDLKDVVLTILQVAEARDAGMTLKNTIDGKASKAVVDDIVLQLTNAIGTSTSLKDAFDALKIDLDDKINLHAGVHSHNDLDVLYEDFSNAKGDYTTLTARLQNLANAIASGGGGTGGTVGNITIQALSTWETTVTLTAGQRDISIPNPYILGNSSLMVYEGPFLMTPGSTNDYVETDNHTITLNYDLPEGTVLRLIGTNSGRLFEWIYRLESIEGQTLINTVFSFTNAFDDLVVYEDGLMLIPGVDYTEVSDHEIQMTQPLPAECNITICKRRY